MNRHYTLVYERPRLLMIVKCIAHIKMKVGPDLGCILYAGKVTHVLKEYYEIDDEARPLSLYQGFCPHMLTF